MTHGFESVYRLWGRTESDMTEVTQQQQQQQQPSIVGLTIQVKKYVTAMAATP